MNPKEELCQRAVEILRGATSVFVMTGAGVSAESGIPTFRGTDGLWKNYSVQDLATPHAFKRDPGLVWDWYRWRQNIILKAQPNPAHYAIVELERMFERFLLLTQNVDNLHYRAGSRKVLEIHGNIFRVRCSECGKENPFTCIDESIHELPRCDCGGLLRPDVVWFGEAIPSRVWAESLDYLNTAQVAVFCGTSGVVWPAAAIPGLAKELRIRTIEINLEPTPFSRTVDVSIMTRAGETLPRIVNALSAAE
ncbi:MAG: NAD-dependent deacylase [candidate division WOR-3 bacterium]|nr:NAD-dependent deacylase [candidate division WOR-3 bacterium]